MLCIMQIRFTKLNLDIGNYQIHFVIDSEHDLSIKIFLNYDKSMLTNKTDIEYQIWYNEIARERIYKTTINVIEHNVYDVVLELFETSQLVDVKSYKVLNGDQIVFDSTDDLNSKMILNIRNNLKNQTNGYLYPLIRNTFNEEEIYALCNFMMSGQKLTMGQHVEEFENNFAKYIGAKYAVMVNSGSSANLLALSVLNNFLYDRQLNFGDEIIVPALCWSTSVWPIIQCGFKPIFVDIDMNTMNLDVTLLSKYLTEKTKAILVVHVMGNCTNMDQLMKFSIEHNLIVIEDTCESLGSSFNGVKLGNFGVMGTYSFYYSHHITTIEGGMITCNDYAIYNILKQLRAHGWIRNLDENEQLKYKNLYPNIDSRYMFVNLGYNVRPIELEAVMGNIQLVKLDQKNENRIYNYNLFRHKLMTHKLNKNILSLFCEQFNSYVAWFGICMYLNKKFKNKYNEFKKYLDENSIENRPIITGNFVKQPYFVCNNFNYDVDEYPNANYVHDCGLYIGLSCEKYSEKEIDDLVDIILSFNFYSDDLSMLVI